MKVLHISAECYPAAKAGGLGDVVGSLPKYQNNADYPAAVVLPKYRTRWVNAQHVQLEYCGAVPTRSNDFVPFTIESVVDAKLGFPLYLVNIIGQFDRPGVYGDPKRGWYTDNTERFLLFQQAVLQWVLNMDKKPGVLHCHDYHTGLIPFLLKHSLDYRSLSDIPTVFTIHNGEYHGAFGWDKIGLLPAFDSASKGLLEWEHRINPLASGIKNAWCVTTVSPSYMEELSIASNGLEWLINNEKDKSQGILNGIDVQVWDPATDPFIQQHFTGDTGHYKWENKMALQGRFKVDFSKPVITFIGRLVREKGADLLPDLYRKVLTDGIEASFIVLGTGEPELHKAFAELKEDFPGQFDVALEYNEGLAHQLYAGSDFLIMPSRVEPCGLNQLYSLRYGTIPIVRSVGGLKDTVIDISDPTGEGRGIRFDQFTLEDGQNALWRSTELFRDQPLLQEVRERIMQLDFSWERSAKAYIDLYEVF